MLKAHVSAVISGLVLSGAAIAATHDAELQNKIPAAKIQAAASSVSQQNVNVNVTLYSAPKSSSKVLEQTDPGKRLVPIFAQGDWVKVGDPGNGNVGWINKQQYRAALKAWYEPNVQTIIVRRDQDKNGKPEVHVIAYSNGKKLDNKQAQAMYDSIKKQQQYGLEAMNRFQQNVNQFFDHENRWIDEQFGSAVLERPFAFEPGPVIIVQQPSSEAHGQSSKAANKIAAAVKAKAAAKTVAAANNAQAADQAAAAANAEAASEAASAAAKDQAASAAVQSADKAAANTEVSAASASANAPQQPAADAPPA